MTDSVSRRLSLPRHRPQGVKAAVLHVIVLARVVVVHVRQSCATSAAGRARLDLQGALNDISLLQEETRVKDARMAVIVPHGRPYYRPIERMAILELRAARGWSQTETARRFLVKPTTIASWAKRIDESGPRPLIQVSEPVNKFPDLVRYVVRRLKVLFPSMGRKGIAQTLTRAGLHLSATTVRRILNARVPDPLPPVANEAIPAKTGTDHGPAVTARRPNHVWHVDLTVVPTASGFWTPWFPLSVPQVWPFCWWVACTVDHYARLVLGFAAFKKQPTFTAVRSFLGQVVRRANACPKYIVCDQGVLFTSDGFKTWCKRKKIRARYGAAHQYGSIAVIERFIKSPRDEWLRRLIIPLRLEAMRKELSVYTSWFNEHRPHQALDACTPREIYEDIEPRKQMRRFELRPGWPVDRDDAMLTSRLTLAVSCHEGRRHLPIIELKRAA